MTRQRWIAPSSPSHPEDLEILVVADGDPVRLRGTPLDRVDLPLGGGVGQDGVLDGAGHLLYVPDEGLVVVARRADVAAGVGCPRNAVDAGSVVVESGHGGAGDAHVQDDDLAGVHGHGGQVVGVLLIPGQPQQGRVRGVLVDDGRVLQVAQVEHANATVGADLMDRGSGLINAINSDTIIKM